MALREQPWGQYKKKIDRWFWWEATYYDDNQQGLGAVDLFNSADTFGDDHQRPELRHERRGERQRRASCTRAPTRLFPASSYGIAGPIASLRLKHWRRGLQDVDYLTLAAAIDSSAVSALVDKIGAERALGAAVPRPDERLLVHLRARELERRPRRLGGRARGARAHHRRAVSGARREGHSAVCASSPEETMN